MATEAEIEAACRVLNIAPMDIRRNDIGLRETVRLALEAVERVRAEERRKHCTHPRRVGSGWCSGDGTSGGEWSCPDCFASGKW